MKPLADGIQELIDLLGRENKGNNGVLLETGDVPKEIFFIMTPAHQELKEGACSTEDGVNRACPQFEIRSHLQEKGGLKGVPAGIFLHQISIQNKKMLSVSLQGVSQILAVSEKLFQFWCQEALKGFHETRPFSFARCLCGDIFVWIGYFHGPASL
jgi:hypothetical protein